MPANIFVVLLSLTLFSQRITFARIRALTTVEARSLVARSLGREARNLPKLSIDLENVKSPGFYEFAVTWDNPSGSVIVGFFAVNRVTGDVWEVVPCEIKDTPELRRLQETLQKKVGLSQADLVKFSSKMPCHP